MSKTLTSMQCPLIGQCPVRLNSVATVHNAIRLLDSSKICVGNSDNYLISQFLDDDVTLHKTSGI